MPIEDTPSRDPSRILVFRWNKNIEVNAVVNEDESLFKFFSELTYGPEGVLSVRQRVNNDDPVLKDLGGDCELKSASPAFEASRPTNVLDGAGVSFDICRMLRVAIVSDPVDDSLPGDDDMVFP